MAERYETRVAVFVILENQAGEILLQKRQNTGYLDGYYETSSSGHLEKGETILQCAVRETREEIGVNIDEDGLQLVHVNQCEAEASYLNFVYLCRTWQGEPRICEPEKCSNLDYFATEQLPEKITIALQTVRDAGFTEKLTYSYIDHEKYEKLLG